MFAVALGLRQNTHLMLCQGLRRRLQTQSTLSTKRTRSGFSNTLITRLSSARLALQAFPAPRCAFSQPSPRCACACANTASVLDAPQRLPSTCLVGPAVTISSQRVFTSLSGSPQTVVDGNGAHQQHSSTKQCASSPRTSTRPSFAHRSV